jgi:hypothetical protein
MISSLASSTGNFVVRFRLDELELQALSDREPFSESELDTRDSLFHPLDVGIAVWELHLLCLVIRQSTKHSSSVPAVREHNCLDMFKAA